jgi:glycosyltransferase involved in cell wall biosynthesis
VTAAFPRSGTGSPLSPAMGMGTSPIIKNSNINRCISAAVPILSLKEENMLSVIIPVYNVEKYIPRCARSLFGQTLEDVEFIFVDDCSTDGSVRALQATLELYPERIPQTRILSHQENGGVSKARNTGMSAAEGDYVYHCDSDDYLEKDMLERLYDFARESGYDIVWSDWYLSYPVTERYMSQPRYASAGEALAGILSGEMKFNVWNKLFKACLFTDNGIRFPEGHPMGDDMTVIRLFACAKDVGYMPVAFYHYARTNDASYTRARSAARFDDIFYNADQTISFIREKFHTKYDRELMFFKLDTKYPFLISDDRMMYRIWKGHYPEADRYILENRRVSVRSRILQYAASKGCFWFVWLHYKIVYGLVYKMIFK